MLISFVEYLLVRTTSPHDVHKIKGALGAEVALAFLVP